MKDNSFLHFMKQFQMKLSTNVYTPLLGKTDPKHIAFLRNLEKEMEIEKSLTIPLKDLHVVVFDMETTGFSPEQGDQILSIGAVKMGETANDTFYSLVRFDGQLTHAVKELTGLDEAELKTAPSLSDVLIRFYEFVQTDTLVAHHATHEKKFLQHANWKIFRKPYKHRIIDTSLVFKLIDPSLKLVSLDDYCEYFEVEVRERHHALGDAQMTAQLWSKFVCQMNEIQCHTLMDVYDQLAKMK